MKYAKKKTSRSRYKTSVISVRVPSEIKADLENTRSYLAGKGYEVNFDLTALVRKYVGDLKKDLKQLG